jgi:hypothetical protein
MSERRKLLHDDDWGVGNEKAGIGKKHIWFEYFWGNRDVQSDIFININYCPMCGRELKGETECKK